MTFVHGKNTFVSLGGTNISAYTNSTTFNREADSHEVTTYGKASKVYRGGLKDAKVTVSGWYDDAATGPHTLIAPLVGTNAAFVFRPEGTGSGKPQSTVDVLVTSYNESSPVADHIQWTAELQCSDTINDAPQA